MKRVLIFCLIIGVSCKEDDLPGKRAMVKFTGDPAVDGCGWLLKVGDDDLKPVNLQKEFQKDGMEVNVAFKPLVSRWRCGWREPGYEEIEITRIKKTGK